MITYDNFLEDISKFYFTYFVGKEWEHLKQHTEKDKENQNEKVSELRQQGKSYREIAFEDRMLCAAPI
jgi:hypothetical protein